MSLQRLEVVVLSWWNRPLKQLPPLLSVRKLMIGRFTQKRQNIVSVFQDSRFIVLAVDMLLMKALRSQIYLQGFCLSFQIIIVMLTVTL